MLDQLDSAVAKLCRGVLAIPGTLLCLVLLVGNIWSASACVIRTFRRVPAESAIKLRDPDPTRPGELRLLQALKEAWITLHVSTQPTLRIAVSQEINAGSFGDGRFIVFEGTTNVSDAAMDGIIAHEVAHDLLRHPQKAAELKDLSDFVAESVAFFTRTDAATEETMKDQMTRAALPRYTKGQEYEADARGAMILEAEGYEDGRKAMADTLRLLIQKSGNTGGGFFDTHPSTVKRVDALLSRP